jgi:hypothetical protein
MKSGCKIIMVGIVAFGSLSTVALAGSLPAPPYDHLGKYRAAGENPYYHVNRYGYGNYVQGPNGAYGGYPAGSAGARELENNHRVKCRVYPESG